MNTDTTAQEQPVKEQWLKMITQREYTPEEWETVLTTLAAVFAVTKA